MSDTSRHDEIEDVLSSIRRLVADGPEQPSPRRGRLVLTPALRVPEEDNGEDAEEDTDDTPEPPDESAGQPVPTPETDSAPADTARALSLADRIAELEAVVAGYDDDEEEDESGEAAAPPPRAGTPAWRASVFPRAANGAGRQAGRRESSEPFAPAPDGDGEAAGGHTPDAGEALPGGPDRGGTANADVPPMEDDGAAGTDATGTPGAEAGAGAGAAANSTALGEERQAGPEARLPDEAVLREIVADIVREELQGRLGERITRNVRKLVRQEINRALASRDFE